MQLFEIQKECKKTLFLNNFLNISATQNQNHNQNWPFLTKDMSF